MQEIAFGAFFQTKKCKSEKMHEVVHFYLKKKARKWFCFQNHFLAFFLDKKMQENGGVLKKVNSLID
jgi:hypothetical protein